MNIFIDDNIPYLSDCFSFCGSVTQFSGRNLSNKDLINGACDALFVRSTTPVNEALLRNSNIQFVGTATAGFDHINLKYLSANNIFFADAAGSNANSVAEYVIYSILLWASRNEIDLRKKIIGIIGFGKVGKLVAKYSHYLGLEALINDPPLLAQGYEFPDKFKYEELSEICSNCDIITNHVPLSNHSLYPTERLLNRDLISSIKKNSLFIHTSRGRIVDESPLLERVKNRDVSTVIDVWENEPLVNIELARLSIIATPHIAGYSRDGKLTGSLAMVNAFENYHQIAIDKSPILNELSSYIPISIEKYNNHNFVLNLLEKNRDLLNDSQILINSLNEPPDLRIKAFDKQRKEYPIKRESL